MKIEELTGSELLLIIIAISALIIKSCMVMNESRISEYHICHDCIVIRRDVMDIEESQENHDALSEVN